MPELREVVGETIGENGNAVTISGTLHLSLLSGLVETQTATMAHNGAEGKPEQYKSISGIMHCETSVRLEQERSKDHAAYDPGGNPRCYGEKENP